MEKYIVIVDNGFQRLTSYPIPVSTLADAANFGKQYGTTADSVRVYLAADRQCEYSIAWFRRSHEGKATTWYRAN